MKATLICSIVSSVVLALPASHASAATGQKAAGPEQKKVEAVQPWAYKRINRAYKALSDDRYDDCIDALDEMKANERLNEHEKSLMWQAYGYVHSARDEYAEAATSFEKCLELEGLAEQAALQTRYNLAQVYVMLERYDDAIDKFQYWFAHVRNPAPSAFYMVAMAYAQEGKHAEALRYAQHAVENASMPKESWLQLLTALRLEEKQYEEAVPDLELLVSLFPKKTYWIQLAAVYSELQRHEKALATMKLAHVQGYLTEGPELMSLAQLYLYNQIPYEAAHVLAQGLESGAIEGTAHNWQLLADSWLHAHERERALAPLRRAAELATDGDVFLRLAQVQVEQEDWAGARQALMAALGKGHLSNPGQAHLLLGIANVNEKRWEEAAHAFSTAEDFEATEKMAQHWLKHLASQRAIEEEAVPKTAGLTPGSANERAAAGTVPVPSS